MIVLIAGSSHTGKTLLAQKLMEKYNYPYFSIDHLKMGLIRSGQTDLTAEDDEELQEYLWSIIKEMIKTVVENKQNLIIEGCYIPFDWKEQFDKKYLDCIKYYCLIMTEDYINKNFDKIIKYADAVEHRLGNPEVDKKAMILENISNLQKCEKYKNNYILIDEDYKVDVDL